MAILMILDIQGGTADQYDQVERELGGTRPDNAPDGLISHSAGVTDGGFLVTDVWESPETLQRFYEQVLGAALQKAGVPRTEPRILPLHNHLHGAGRDGSVIVVVEMEGMTTDDYDRLSGQMAAHAGDGSNHPAVSHVAAAGESGVVVVDVWPSLEQWQAFVEEQIAPLAGDRMGRVEPRVARLHNHVAVKQPAAH